MRVDICAVQHIGRMRVFTSRLSVARRQRLGAFLVSVYYDTSCGFDSGRYSEKESFQVQLFLFRYCDLLRDRDIRRYMASYLGSVYNYSRFSLYSEVYRRQRLSVIIQKSHRCMDGIFCLLLLIL